MPVSTEATNLVRQKSLSSPALDRDPGGSLALKAFFRYMSENRGNPDLEYYTFAALADDTVAVDAACTLFYAYMRKQNTAVDAYAKIFDNASSTGTAADERVTLFFADGRDTAVLWYPQGQPMAAGVVLTSHTTSSGTTDSAAADGPDGFLIWGATGL